MRMAAENINANHSYLQALLQSAEIRRDARRVGGSGTEGRRRVLSTESAYGERLRVTAPASRWLLLSNEWSTCPWALVSVRGGSRKTEENVEIVANVND